MEHHSIVSQHLGNTSEWNRGRTHWQSVGAVEREGGGSHIQTTLHSACQQTAIFICIFNHFLSTYPLLTAAAPRSTHIPSSPYPTPSPRSIHFSSIRSPSLPRPSRFPLKPPPHALYLLKTVFWFPIVRAWYGNFDRSGEKWGPECPSFGHLSKHSKRWVRASMLGFIHRSCRSFMK